MKSIVGMGIRRQFLWIVMAAGLVTMWAAGSPAMAIGVIQDCMRSIGY